MRCKLLVSFVMAAACSGFVLGCVRNDKDVPITQRKVRVVTTTTMITDAVKIIGGERVEVHGLMGPGADPHLYEPSPGVVPRMERADVVFYNGLHLEGKMGEVFAQMKGRTKTVAVTDGIPRQQLRNVANLEGGLDPHVWFDVELWMKAIEHIRDGFIGLDPDHKDIYATNAKKHLEELAELHQYVKTQAARIPPQQRVLVTAHDAFGYFARAYGFEVKSLQGVTTDAEASISDREELAKFIAERRIPVMFVELSVPRKSIEAVQEAVKARGFTVSIGGELFSDSLGSPDEPAGNYVGMVRANIDTMVKALKPIAD